MSTDFTDRRSSIECESMSITLLPFADRNDTLALAIPCQITNAACNDLDFDLEDLVSACAVPDSDIAGNVAACNVESRRRESRYCRRLYMADIFSADTGVLRRQRGYPKGIKVPLDCE